MANELILIADDNDDIREFVGAALREDGYEVVEAKDGKSALEKFATRNPDILFLSGSMG